MTKDNRTVYQRTDKKWVNLLNGNKKASSVHNTQKEAIESAKNMARNNPEGGEITIMGTNHLIRQKDTIAPANDPRNIKG